MKTHHLLFILIVGFASVSGVAKDRTTDHGDNPRLSNRNHTHLLPLERKIQRLESAVYNRRQKHKIRLIKHNVQVEMQHYIAEASHQRAQLRHRLAQARSQRNFARAEQMNQGIRRSTQAIKRMRNIRRDFLNQEQEIRRSLRKDVRQAKRFLEVAYLAPRVQQRQRVSVCEQAPRQGRRGQGNMNQRNRWR